MSFTLSLFEVSVLFFEEGEEGYMKMQLCFMNGFWWDETFVQVRNRISPL